jgi:hypothetical protein
LVWIDKLAPRACVAASLAGRLLLAAICLFTFCKLTMPQGSMFETGTASLSLANLVASGPVAAGRHTGCEASGEIWDKSQGGCLHPQKDFPGFHGARSPLYFVTPTRLPEPPKIGSTSNIGLLGPGRNSLAQVWGAQPQRNPLAGFCARSYFPNCNTHLKKKISY